MIPQHARAGGGQTLSQLIKRVRIHTQRGVRLARRAEALLHSDVQLLCTNLKPRAAAPAQWLRLVHLGQSKQISKEPSRRVLAAHGRGDLNVVQANETHGH